MEREQEASGYDMIDEWGCVMCESAHQTSAAAQGCCASVKAAEAEAARPNLFDKIELLRKAPDHTYAAGWNAALDQVLSLLRRHS